jgi:hypothetical protein
MTTPYSPVRSSVSPSDSLTITPVTAAQAARAALPPGDWSTGDFCAYVIEEITRIHGPQLPAKGVQAALEGFCERFSVAVAVQVARAAFEVHNGFWEGAPVTWRRFAEGHDSFFARPILAAMR